MSLGDSLYKFYRKEDLVSFSIVQQTKNFIRSFNRRLDRFTP